MTSTTSYAATLSHHCHVCGGEFTVDSIAGYPDRFLVHLTVRNTGERGRLSLRLDNSRVFVLNPADAASWSKAFPSLVAQQRTPEAQDRLTTVYIAHPSETALLPAAVEVGDVWEGWFETLRRPLPADATGLLFLFGPFTQGDGSDDHWHWVCDETHPYLGLAGEVTVKPLSAPGRWWARLSGSIVRFIRGIFRLEVASMLVAMVIGKFIGDWTLGGWAGFLIPVAICTAYVPVLQRNPFWVRAQLVSLRRLMGFK